MKIDIDALFDEYLNDFIEKNGNVLSATDIEKKIADLYVEFGNAPCDELGGLSPIEYFNSLPTEELLTLFKEGIEDGDSASDYLCSALEKRVDAEDRLLEMALGKNEELAVCAINVLSAMSLEKSLKKFVEVLSTQKPQATIIDVLTEALCANADIVKEYVIKAYNPNGAGAESFEEVFSNMSKDERVFKLLYACFLNSKSNLAINASYLAKYGDDRALTVLYSTFKRNDLSIIEYSEIKNAIEKLGGEVEDDGRFVRNAH